MELDNETTNKIQNFYFVVYFSNPAQQRVTAHIDGDKNPLVLDHSTFLNLIRDTCGNPIIPYVSETLTTYGTRYLLDRENQTINRVNIKHEVEDPSAGQIKSFRTNFKSQFDTNSGIDSLAYAGLDLINSQPSIKIR